MPRRRLPTRLLLLHVLLFAAIGAAATVLVAWVIAVYVRATRSSYPPGMPRSADAVGVPDGWPRPEVMTVNYGIGWGIGFGDQDPPDGKRAFQVQWRSTGWPMRSLQVFVCIEATAPAGGSSFPSVALHKTSGALPGLLHVPADPLWPGFLVDTAFWGGAASLVWSVPGFVRRGMRRRRGRCVRCGYELAGVSMCPECGDISKPA